MGPAITELPGAAPAASQRDIEAELASERVKIENLIVALDSARRIGAAVGVLMVRHQITYEQGFQALASASQHRNRKVRDLAEDVLYVGDLTTAAVA